MRNAIKSPATDRAFKTLLNKLDNLTDNDQLKISVLEQSIFNNWKGIFPVNEVREQPKAKIIELNSEKKINWV